MPNRSHLPKFVPYAAVPREEELRVISESGLRVPQCAPNGHLFLARLDAPKVRVRPELRISPQEFYRRMIAAGQRLYRPFPETDPNCVVVRNDHALSERRWPSPSPSAES